MRTIGILLAALCLVVVVAPAQADDGWSLPNLNPFSQSKKKSSTRPVSTSTVTAPLVKTWRAASSGTKKVVGGTVDVITLKPWRQPKRGTQPSWSNWNPGASAPQKKSSWFSSLFGREEPSQPAGVTDWMSQPRPSLSGTDY